MDPVRGEETLPIFRYVAIDRTGRPIRGVVEAEAFQNATLALKEQGLWVVRLAEKKPNLLFREVEFGSPRVPLKVLTQFSRQLATLLESGVPLASALRTLYEQTEHRVFRRVLLHVVDEINSGTFLHKAVEKYPGVFPEVFAGMVRAGELGGGLPEMLDRLATYFEKEYETREKVKAALTYPAFVAVTAIIVVASMMIFVMPRFAANFAATGMELPLLTQIVFKASVMTASWWFVIPLVVAGGYTANRLLRRTPQAAYYLDFFKLKVPIFGKLLHKQALARFSRTFASLYSSSVPLLHMLPLVAAVAGNRAIARPIEEAVTSLYSGGTLAEPFARSTLYPRMVADMLAVGERTGAIGETMEKLAEFYEQEVDAMADSLKSILEPALMVILSGVVGVIVLSMMLPTYTMIGNIN